MATSLFIVGFLIVMAYMGHAYRMPWLFGGIAVIMLGCIALLSYVAVDYEHSLEGQAIYGESKPEENKQFDFRTFDRRIISDAPGCEIRSPKGDLMNEIFKGTQPNTLTLEKGTTFTIDCFPILESEKSTTVDPQTDKPQ